MSALSIYKDYSLLGHNTFGMDVMADYFVEYNSIEDLETVRQMRLEGALPDKYLFVGEGSNLLFTQDFRGVVLHSAIKTFEVLSEDNFSVRVRVGSGWNWDSFVSECVDRGWWGLENLSYIPGQVGSCAVQNIGAYGVEAKDLIELVEVFDFEQGIYLQLSKDECKYGYRDSIFKSEAFRKYAVTAVVFALRKLPSPNFSYKQLAEAFQGETDPKLSRIRDAVINIRKGKLPEPSEIGSAGSFFKNPVVPIGKFEELQKKYPSIPYYRVEGNGSCMKLSAGWLIEQCGWKGRSVGRAGVYHKQALVIVNLGGAIPSEVLSLVEKVISSVVDKFGIELSPEVIIL